MCSLDAISLFTKVYRLIRRNKSTKPGYIRFLILPGTVLKTLLEFATKKSQFIFYGKFYEPTDGVAMGSPVGPVLAHIFMCYFEEKWVMTRNALPSIWFRYVDDTFTMFHSK